MRLRTLYLRRLASINGRNSLSGRQLYDQFRNISEDCLLGYAVLPDEKASLHNSDDIISYDLLKRFDPNVIYLERGLFWGNDGTWRIPRSLAEKLVASGTIFVVTGVGIDEAREHKRHYMDASTFFHASIEDGKYGDPVYAEDRVFSWGGSYRQIICKPEQMIFTEWLRPVYNGVSELKVIHPIKLKGWQHLVATTNSDTTYMQGDPVISWAEYCPFASAANRGLGYVVFITAHVSYDNLGDNVKWLTNLCQFLLEESSRDRSRVASHLRSPYTLFLSHRSVDAEVVKQIASEIKHRGVAIWLDKEKLVPSDSLIGEINRGLEQMSHFVLFWSKDCVGSFWIEKELKTATSLLINSGRPIFIIRLDDTPVPAILADLYRIEGTAMSSEEVGNTLVDAVERLEKRKRL